MYNKKEVLNKLEFSHWEGMIKGFEKGNGNTASGICPFHDDDNASLTIFLDQRRFFCHACKEKGDAHKLYQKVNGVNYETAKMEVAEMVGFQHESESKKLVETYNYTDENGVLLFKVERYEPKTFRQKSANGVYKLDGVRRVLYNLPALLSADTVFIVEGEKDADNLNRIGLVATTSSMGAKSWRREYSESLTGKNVVILPDNDKIGKEHAQLVAKNLQGKAKTTKVIELDGLMEKGDVSNWLEAGHTKEELIKLAENTAEWNEQKKQTPWINSVDLVKTDRRCLNWIIDGFIRERCTIMFSGAPGTMKSYLSLYIAKCVAEGKECMGRKTTQKVVYYIDKENSESVVLDRLVKIGSHPNLLLWPGWGPLKATLGNIMEMIDWDNEPLIILDSLIRFHDFDENNAQEMKKIAEFTRDMENRGATVIVIHHAGKDFGSTYRGSSEIQAGFDVGYSIFKSKYSDKMTIMGNKDRFMNEVTLKLQFVEDVNGIIFKDITNDVKENKALQSEAELDIIREIIEMLSCKGIEPIQSSIMNAAKGKSIPDKRVRELLKIGKGRLWTIEKKGIKNASIYKLILDGDSIYRQTDKLTNMREILLTDSVSDGDSDHDFFKEDDPMDIFMDLGD